MLLRPAAAQVGAGGNAGNQSAIKVIRGLATGTMRPTGAGVRRAMTQQLAVGLMLGAGLAAGGWLRVYVTNGDALNATAIAISLFLIVVCSVIAGTGKRCLQGPQGFEGTLKVLWRAADGRPSLDSLPACLDCLDEASSWMAGVKGGSGQGLSLPWLLLAAGLPFALARAGIDPANAGTSIQVIGRAAAAAGSTLLSCRATPEALAPHAHAPSLPLTPRPAAPLVAQQVIMDVSGVLITCATCHLVLDQLAAGLSATS